MALRTREGVDVERLAELGGARLPEERIDVLLREGLLRRSDGRITVTAEGLPVLDRIVLELL